MIKPWMLKKGGYALSDGSYSYRKSVTLSRPSGAVTDYQMFAYIGESERFSPHNMTSNSLPAPFIVSASSQLTGSNDAYRAFNGNTGSWVTNGTTTGWIKLDLSATRSRKLTSYTIMGANTGDQVGKRSPKDWTVQGSNDDSNWTTVDTVTGETGWGSAESRTYICDSPSDTAFRYYKLDITANNGDPAGYVGICEWYLNGPDFSCNGKVKTDFSDLRFTTSDGATDVKYWIESIIGTTPNQIAMVWLKAPSVGTSDTTFYMYYGNEAASAVSSVTATFPFADDFDDASIDTDKWYHWIDNGSETESGGEFAVTGHASYNAWGAKTKFGTDYAFRGRVKVNNDTTGTDINIFAIDDRSDDGTAVGTGVDQAAIRGTGENKRWITGRESTATITDRTPTFTSYKIAEIRRNSTTSVIFTVDDVVSETITTNVPTDACGFLIYSNHASTVVTWDWVLVRKYLAVEPTWGAWGDEEAA